MSKLSELVGKLDRLHGKTQAGNWVMDIEPGDDPVENTDVFTGKVIAYDGATTEIIIADFEYHNHEAEWTAESHNIWPELRDGIKALQRRLAELESLAGMQL